ncbi:Gfo/Idh/MocA family protein [Parvularcula lutaonensis]|uniref:Gfo/Idh/MocA family protein n=1 Tax=Parvularcula lutaonensis TaxID=491923 RepID=A0ABV7M7D6_9PROT|nr:Gfo/Idh/MocA family oxidoreductase [Parvularcula lutaonensis]GGY41704.1 hypothetical protein GCM10007148_07880 [Parvularcula lutaonensis]
MALRIGIVGTGKIARQHAAAMGMTDAVEIVAVASRSKATAEAFAADFGRAEAVEGTHALLALPSVEAVYIATPTSAKEGIALAAIEAGKHVLVEKPLASDSSAQKLAEAAKAMGVAVMDATHFTHNPRTHTIRKRKAKDIGTPQSLFSVFHAHVGGPENIRFDTELEPQGALGDLGWYCCRAVIELLEPRGALASAEARGTWEGDALTAVTALLDFEDGTRASFDCGFRAGAFSQDLILVGSEGILSMDDFVHDFERGHLLAPHPDIPSGYTLRKGRMARHDRLYIETPAPKSHVILLLEEFARLAADPRGEATLAAGARMGDTQALVDAAWRAAIAAR